jgi:hypothetical protein
MMSPEQVRTVAQVYRQFIENESHRGWDEIDNYLLYLDFLDDDQLHREADVVYVQHKDEKVGCDQDHKLSDCFVPKVIDAVNAILELYKVTGHMHKNNRYILQYYIAITQAGMIRVLS